jgi:hypothetical protein
VSADGALAPAASAAGSAAGAVAVVAAARRLADIIDAADDAACRTTAGVAVGGCASSCFTSRPNPPTPEACVATLPLAPAAAGAASFEGLTRARATTHYPHTSSNDLPPGSIEPRSLQQLPGQTKNARLCGQSRCKTPF